MNVRFPGQYFDKETGLAYNMERDYDSQTARYVQSDPLGLRGGLNTYSYVASNPLQFIDPLGLDMTFHGYSKAELARVKAIVERVRQTQRGEQLCRVADRMDLKIVNSRIPGFNALEPQFSQILFDPNADLTPYIFTTEGRIPASLERIFAHELGHAAGGPSDFKPDGTPDMTNINLNENPVAQELGQPLQITPYGEPRRR